MSDFLTHLAARAVAPVPAVRPLARSHFEPVPGGEITWPAAPPSTAPREVETPPAAPPQACPAPEAKGAIDVTRDVTENFIPPRVPASRRPAAALEHETPPLPAASSSSPPTPPALHPAAVVAAAGTPVPVRFAVGTGLGQDARTTGGAGILPAAAPVPPEHPAAAPALLSQLPLGPRPQLLPAAATALSNQPPARAALPPPLAPQVTITIGRVEIRAAALPVQPITPVVSGPPLSLETYLRRSASRTA